MTFRSPVGFPVLVHAQVGDSYKVFYGLALRNEDAYNLGSQYEGKISVVRLAKSWGQNENIEIIHGIEHYNHLISATYWIYLDQFGLMVEDFNKSWDKKNKIRELSKLLSQVAIILRDTDE